jgi:RNA polymerase sigma-70 factor (ECF subfamily)
MQRSTAPAEPRYAAGMTEPLDDTFRRSSQALVASLTRALGPRRLDLVESAVQEAFVRAMREWPRERPENPEGWLLAVARNLALDQLRRERVFQGKEADVARFVELTAPAPAVEVALGSELADDQLRMMFVACHPCNTLASQIALALRTLCGLDVRAIARALYASEDAIEKRLVLARRRLREEDVSFELPEPDELGARLDAVLRVLYVSFSEAHWLTSGPDLVDEDVAGEAIRLVAFLADHPLTRRPRVLALLALMHFHAARFPARIDDRGYPATLGEQDRARWDRAHIDAGLRALALSATGDDASPYHFEAAIAAVHATSPSLECTDWASIVGYYDELVARYPSPSARLSRAIAISHHRGPRAGIAELDSLDRDPALAAMSAFHAARGECLLRADDGDAARTAYIRARELATNPVEQRYLERRLGALTA